ncbi:uncharacterized protein BXIN_2358 [Babesia sp. Xinjiang]|uniref:uncharacterized protein n=1 Tax=Babesia sp. Xinjiang TaxID=462227 RepID=UPI000A229857|nr:uncharacterized protein BXIN_2358 [Babesia sp. Xinjiang]ORM40675.1 hypothetical protein BXIN_2358 [Babesia sp. Xinjiang]
MYQVTGKTGILWRTVARWSANGSVTGRVVGVSSEMAAANYEPPPFDFEALDAMVNKDDEGPNPTIINAKTGISLDKNERPLIYSLLREANATVYAAKNLGKKKLLIDSSTDSQRALNAPGEWICERISHKLLSYSLDMRIIVLQRALAAWHHSGVKQWNRLAKTALRSCFVNDEVLTSEQLVKICASLSKWRFKGIGEVQHKLDLAILAEDKWDINKISHLLWSLAHLKAFDLRAFDYMNNILTTILNEPEFDLTEVTDDTIHRILNANIVKMSHTGRHHIVLIRLLKALETQPIAVSQLSPKTILAVTAILPLCPESGTIPHIVRRISQSMHRFTHAQSAHMFYNLALLTNIATKVLDQLVGSLFEFKEMLYNTDAAYVPSLTAKLLYTFRTFLGGFDHRFVSKCLADLNANMHLLGPFSLVGNLQVIELYMAETGQELNEQQVTSLKNTRLKLVRTDNHGDFVKPLFEEQGEEPIGKMKLWHYGAIYRLTNCGKVPMMTKLIQFMDQVTEDSLLAALKDFLLFIVNISGQRELCKDRMFLNSVLIVSTQLWSMSTNNRAVTEYWVYIKFHLAVLGLLKVFERECHTKEDKSGRRISTANPIAGLSLTLDMESCGNVEIESWLKAAAKGELTATSASDIILLRYMLFICVAHRHPIAEELDINANHRIRRLLTDCFYGAVSGPLFNTNQSSDKITSDVLEFLNRAMEPRVQPLNRNMAYTKLFFMQDMPQLMMALLPEVTLSELLPQERYDVPLCDVALWLVEVKHVDTLTRYLEKAGEVKSETHTHLREVSSNLDIAVFNIKSVRYNFHFGPYMCHIGIFGEDASQVILVFFNGAYSDCHRHTFDNQRRLTLKKMGVQFVELANVDI